MRAFHRSRDAKRRQASTIRLLFAKMFFEPIGRDNNRTADDVDRSLNVGTATMRPFLLQRQKQRIRHRVAGIAE